MRTKSQLAQQSMRAVWLYWIVFVLGLGLHLAGAFHGNIWFDESYSVALARHPLPELLSMAATDVHPPAYYVMLRLVALVSGTSITAERLFSVAGVATLAALGWTHIRRDLGLSIATCYSALVLFAPWTATEALDIRMYAWAATFVMLCWVYTARAIKTLLQDHRLPRARLWVAAFGWALAAAYTHYIAAMASAVAMFLLLCACIAQALLCSRAAQVCAEKNDELAGAPGMRQRLFCWRSVGIFVAGALLDFVAYLPWFDIMRTQKAAVQKSFWITLNWPDDYLRLYKFPWFSDEVEELACGLWGSGFEYVVRALLAVVFVLVVFVVLRGLVALVRTRSIDLALWGFGGLCVLWGCLGMAIFAGRMMGQPIIMPRYLYVAVGPQLLGLSVLLRCPHKLLSAGRQGEGKIHAQALQQGSVKGHLLPAALCVLTAVLGISTAGLAAQRNYDPANWAALDFYRTNAQADGTTTLVVAGYPVWNNILAAGPLAELAPEIPQLMEDTIPAYCAYGPQVRLVPSAADAPEVANYHGKIIFISYAKNDGSIFRFASEAGAHIVSINHFERPYKTEDWCIAVLERP